MNHNVLHTLVKLLYNVKLLYKLERQQDFSSEEVTLTVILRPFGYQQHTWVLGFMISLPQQSFSCFVNISEKRSYRSKVLFLCKNFILKEKYYHELFNVSHVKCTKSPTWWEIRKSKQIKNLLINKILACHG